MLTLTHHPAATLLGTDEWEAYSLGLCDWASCIRACPLEACAEACGSALFWLASKYLPLGCSQKPSQEKSSK